MKYHKFRAGALKKKAFAIIDDRTRKDVDLLLVESDVYVVSRNKISYACAYKDITYSSTAEYGDALNMNGMEYRNANVNIRALYSLIKELAKLTDQH